MEQTKRASSSGDSIESMICDREYLLP